MSYFLRAIQEESDFRKSIQIIVDGKNIAEEDMSSGTLYGELQDWIEQYSKYKDF
jgi:hypothetical protein